MEKYKKLSLKNDEDADNLVDHLNKDWTIFKEFPGWVVMFRDPNVVVSPAEPEKPSLRPHREWFYILKEPLRSQALEAMTKYPMEDSPLSSSIAEAFACAFSWTDSGTMDKWCGVHDFFNGSMVLLSDSEYGGGYELAKECAPDGWETQQGAGE